MQIRSTPLGLCRLALTLHLSPVMPPPPRGFLPLSMKRHLLTVLSHNTHHSEPHSECSGSFTRARHIVGTQLMCANQLNAFQWLLHSHQSWLREARFYCISTNIIEYKLCSRAWRQIDQEFRSFFHLFRSFPGG